MFRGVPLLVLLHPASVVENSISTSGLLPHTAALAASCVAFFSPQSSKDATKDDNRRFGGFVTD